MDQLHGNGQPRMNHAEYAELCDHIDVVVARRTALVEKEPQTVAIKRLCRKSPELLGGAPHPPHLPSPAPRQHFR